MGVEKRREHPVFFVQARVGSEVSTTAPRSHRQTSPKSRCCEYRKLLHGNTAAFILGLHTRARAHYTPLGPHSRMLPLNTANWTSIC